MKALKLECEVIILLYFFFRISHTTSFYRLIKLVSASQSLHWTSSFPTYSIPGPTSDSLFLFADCNKIPEYFTPSASPALSSNAYTDHPAQDRKASI